MSDEATPPGTLEPDSPAGTPEEKLAAFGRWLARERELRGISRDEVGRAIKLPPGVAEALEAGEESRIPPRAYVVGYLRGYATAVGLDADEVLLRFEEAVGPVTAPARARSRRPGPAAVVAVIAAVVVATAIALALLR